MINATKVKICGITNQIDAKLAVDFGADAIGFVFAKSPRQVDVRIAKKNIATLPPFVSKIGVFVNETPLVIQKIYQECGLTAVQLHGEEIPDYVNY